MGPSHHGVTVNSCGARTRSGTRCRRRPMRNGRCYLHGGPSCGARVHRARDMRPAWAARARRVAERRALGLKSPGGRPRGRWAWKAKSETEALMRKAEDVIESLPAAPDRPIEEWTLSEILTDNVRKYLTQSNAILSQHIKLRL